MKKQKKHSVNYKKILLLLKKEGCSDSVVKHSLSVSKLASEIARKLKKNGYKIDLDFIKTASLLHDIGRAKTHSISHGIEGGKILKELKFGKNFVRVCENHIGAGITKEEAIRVGLPPKNFIPKTLEEKVIAHADNLILGERVVSIKKTINKLKKELGSNHPAISRVSELSAEIERLIMSKSKSK